MIDLDELMRLREAATPGPWQVKIGDFESEDGYGTVTAPYVEANGKTICVPTDRGPDDDNDEDDAEFEERVANYNPCLSCVDHPKICPRELSNGDSLGDEIVACRIKHASLAVEAEMIAEGKGPGRREKA